MDRAQAINMVRKEPGILGLMPGALHEAVASMSLAPFR